MGKRATRSAAPISKSASSSFVPTSASFSKREIPMKMPQAKKQKTVAQALADDPEPDENNEE